MNIQYELKLKSGKTTVWSGSTPKDAAHRYVDCYRREVVLATRSYLQHGTTKPLDWQYLEYEPVFDD